MARVTHLRPKSLRRRAGRRAFSASKAVAALTAGTASLVTSGPAGIALTATDATGGTPGYTYAWYRSVSGGAYNQLFNGGGVSGAGTLSLTDGSASAGTVYGYKVLYEDSALSQTYSNAVTAQVYTGGALTGGGGGFGRGMNGGING